MIKRNTQILLGVFALLLVALFVVRNLPDDAEDTPVDDFPTQAVLPTLFEFGVEEVAGFRIENAEGQAVEMEYADEAWVMIEPEAAAADVDQIRAAGLVPQLTILRLVTESPLESPLDVLGLAAPAYTLTIRLTSGESHVLAIGAASITNTGYYVSLDGEAPKLVTKSALDQFINLIETPPLAPTPLPTTEEGG